MLRDIIGRNILIKTYLAESGLFYLAKSLGEVLSKNNNVIYIPKAKYLKSGPRHDRIYPTPSDPGLLSDINHIEFVPNKSVESQVIKACRDYDISDIISLETLMKKAQWVTLVKSECEVKVHDIPMPEWVEANFLKNSSYKVFDSIWCLTDTSYKMFSGYKGRMRVEWDYASTMKVGCPPKKSLERPIFYHQASLNPEFSQKNTLEVIGAFLRLEKVGRFEYSLIITGRLTRAEADLAKKSKNIILINEVLTEGAVRELYCKAHCVIAPSTREGLGLSFYEAKKAGCSIITTDADPMNAHTDYLCEVISYNKDRSIIPHAITNAENILKQVEKFCEDFEMTKNIEIKKKTKQQIDEENESLMSAFDGAGESDSDSSDEGELDKGTLEALKKKMQQKSQKSEKEDTMEVVSTRSVAIELAVIGVGQAGSRIAEVFHKKGYDAGVINTSAQDLEYIEVLDNQKLLLDGSLGGTGKDLDLGREIFEDNISKIMPFVDEVADGNHMLYLAVSGGGGTGSSSVDTLVPMLFETGLPVGVIYVLPKATEDAQSKRNSIETLSRLARMTADNMVSNLIVVDNARIEQIYANLSQSKFWETSNNAIVEPLHVFNSLTAKPSRFTSLDPSDFGKIISCGDCSTYGVIEVEDYMEETSLAEAVIDSLGSNMLASGFDLGQTRTGGVIITGPKETLEKIPAININYCFHMISEQTNGASIFQGVYDVDSDSDSVKIYSWFAGLGLPKDRVDSLKKESRQQAEVASEKEKNRASAMTLDLEENQVANMATEINRKIKKKKSGFNRLQKGGASRSSIIDRRKRR